MKKGSLVKLKPKMFWQFKNKVSQSRHGWLNEPVLVIQQDWNAIKILTSSGEIKSSLAEWWDEIT